MAEVNKISSFKSFSEIKAQETAMKLREENNLKRQQTLTKIEEILDEMGVSSISDIDEDTKLALISKLFTNVSEDEADDIEDEIVKMGTPKKLQEGNAFIYAAAKARQEGKEEFEFNGKTYKVTLKKDTGLKESYTLLVTEGTRGFFGKIDKSGNISAVYTHYDSYPENMLPIIKKSFKNAKNVDAVIAKGDNSGLDFEIDKMNFYNDSNSMTPLTGKKDNFSKFKRDAKGSGAEFVYLYDESDKKWYMADTAKDKELKPAFESVEIEEGNAFGDAVRKAKEAGEKEFEFDGETYKVEEHLDEAISRSEYDRMDGLHNIKAMDALINSAKTIFDDLTEEMFEFDEICDFIVMKLKKSKLAKMYESSVNEGKHGMAKKLLQSLIKGETSSMEGIKMSKELADHYLNWINTSPYGKKNENLPLYMLVKASFNWGIERGLPKELKGELEDLKSSIKESVDVESIDEARSINKIQNDWSKITSDMAAKAQEWKAAEGDAKTALLSELKEMTAKKKALEAELDAAVAGKDKDLELVVKESTVTEGAVKQFDADFNDMVKNIKSGYGWIDPEFVADTWENSSDSIDFELVKTEIYKRLIATGLLWTSEDGEEKDKQIKSLKELGIKESVEVNEAEIKSDEEFKEYAMSVLKKAFGADFDEAKANEVVNGILGKCDGDYGACVGMLTSSLGESVVTEGFDANYWEDYHEAAGKIENPSGMQVQQEVSACVEEWNDNNENGEENEVTPNGEKKVLKLAKEFVKAKGWISSDVIEAMIAQES